MVALAGLEQLRERAVVPGEFAAVDDDAADGRAVPADELGGRMHHDIRAVLDGPAQIRRGESVVDHQRQIGRSCAIAATASISSTFMRGLPMVSP